MDWINNNGVWVLFVITGVWVAVFLVNAGTFRDSSVPEHNELNRLVRARFKSRKFFIAVMVFTFSTLALFAGVVSEDVWFNTTVAVLSLYGSANVLDKLVQRWGVKADDAG